VRPWDVTVTPHLREKEADGFRRQTSFQLRHVGEVGDLGDEFWGSGFRPVYATCFAYRRNVLDFHVRSLNFSFSPVGAALLCCRLLETALPAAPWSQSGHAPTEGSHLGSIRVHLAFNLRGASAPSRSLFVRVSRIRSRPSVRIHSQLSTHNICPRARPLHLSTIHGVRSLASGTADCISLHPHWTTLSRVPRRLLQHDHVLCRSLWFVGML